MIFLDIQVEDIEAYVKKLSDKCLLRELHVAEQAIDSEIFKHSCMYDVFVYMVECIHEECVSRLEKRLGN